MLIDVFRLYISFTNSTVPCIISLTNYFIQFAFRVMKMINETDPNRNIHTKKSRLLTITIERR